MKNNTSIRQIANLIISKILLIIGSIWSYIPIILGILIPMTIIIPLAYASWFISSLLPGGLSLYFEAYIPISIEKFSIQNIFLLTLEGIIFVGGLLIFLLGFYHLMKGKKQKVSIVSTGIYQSIRHPLNLGICLIALPFTLYSWI